MNRYQDRGEIYLLSLDTFMIMAVLGLTLGMIFMILNPAVGMLPPDPTEEVNYPSLADSQFQELRNCISVNERDDDEFWEVQGENGIEFNIFITHEQENISISVRAYDNENRVIEGRDRIHNLVQSHPCLNQHLINYQ